MKYTLGKFSQDINSIKVALKEQPTFDQILTPMRGGLIPATFLSYELDVPMAICNYQPHDGKNNNIEYLNVDPAATSILIVDDICDSGGTFTFLEGELRRLYPHLEYYCFMSLLVRDDANQPTTAPDNTYAARVVKGHKWVEFFWEKINRKDLSRK